MPIASQIRTGACFIFHLLTNEQCYSFNRTSFHVRLIDGAYRIFLTCHAATGNWTHISSVAPLLRDLSPGGFTDWATAAAAWKVQLSLKCFSSLEELPKLFLCAALLSHNAGIAGFGSTCSRHQLIWQVSGVEPLTSLDMDITLLRPILSKLSTHSRMWLEKMTPDWFEPHLT